MRAGIVLIAAGMLTACTAPSSTTVPSSAILLSANAKVYALKDLPDQGDNVKNDTLLVYTTHDLGNCTFVMAARNQDDTREGLRLYLYKPRPDSSADVIAVSSPAYDSYTMLPTFFTTGDTADGIIILTNLGEKESWGQKTYWLKDHLFKELGFLDVAERGWKTQDDSTYQFRTNIAPRVHVRGENGNFEFTFTGDSLQLYDDLQGGQEVMLATPRLIYRTIDGHLVLIIDGQPRLPKEPA